MATLLHPGRLSPTRQVPANIPRPEYVGKKNPTLGEPDVKDADTIARMRVACRLAAQALEEVGRHGCRRSDRDRARAREPHRECAWLHSKGEGCRQKLQSAPDPDTMRTPHMRIRRLNVGCFGGGTGSAQPARRAEEQSRGCTLNAVVTMFDSGGSSGQLRDELGVLPPGDILKCALALARNAREARRVLLARLPTLEHARLGGHTGGNLLLSMMQRYSGDFLDADRRSARAARLPRPRLAGQRAAGVGLRRVRRRLDDARRSRSRRGADRRASFVRRIWLEPPVSIHPAVAKAIGEFDAVDHRSGQLLHQPDADFSGARRRRGAGRR